MTESEAALELDFFWKKRGGQGFSFDPIIAFGANSSMPHYRAGITPLKKGDTVLIDIGVMVNNYHSDMTRTVFFGEPHPEMRKIYNIVREAQTRALDAVKPGVHAGELDKAARGYIEAEGYGPQFSHSLGHGVGLEIHEWPFLRNRVPMADIPIKEGMCLTVEPGIYIEGLGGVRIEDSIIVTQEGYRSLTNRPTELSVLPC
jgi:Xaa-Pro aminopeptidase